MLALRHCELHTLQHMELPSQPDQDEILRRVFLGLDDETLIQFNGQSVQVYHTFDPALSPSELREQEGLDADISFTSLDLHMPPTYEYLPTKKYASLADVPVPEDPAETVDDNAAYHAQQEAMRPFAHDIDHLRTSRRMHAERLTQEVRELAIHTLATSDERDLDARIPCSSCARRSGEVCGVDCDGSGTIPKHSDIIFVNELTGDSTSLRVDPLRWIADGELTLQWRTGDEVGIDREGLHVDVAAFLDSRLREIGIDHTQSLRVSIDKQYVHYPYFTMHSTLIDESTPADEALSQIETDIAKMFFYSVMHKYEGVVTLRPKRSATEVLNTLIGLVGQTGHTLGYRHKASKDTWWALKHSFVYMSTDGREIIDILEDQVLEGLDEVDLALENALQRTMWLLKNTPDF